MRQFGKVFLAMAVLFSASVGLAGPVMAEGPRLVMEDAKGDVKYGSAWIGARDHDHLDILAAGVDFDNRTDSVVFALPFADTTYLKEPPSGWEFLCRLYVELYLDGEMSATMLYAWGTHTRVGIDGPSGKVQSEVTLRVTHADATGPTGHGVESESEDLFFDHEMDITYGPSGEVQFSVARQSLMSYGEELRARQFVCAEWFDPGRTGLLPLWGPTYVHNWDAASGNGSFAFSDLDPVAAPSVPEPWEMGDDLLAPAVGIAILVKLLIGWWLYARLSKRQILNHQARVRLLALIGKHPGVRQRQLMRLSGLAPGALAHHLQSIQKNGLIKSIRYYGFTCYFVAETDARHVAGLAALSTPAAREILDEVRRRPGITAAELARLRNVHSSSILHHVRRLVEAGLLVRSRSRLGLELLAVGAEGSQNAEPRDSVTSPA